MHPKQLNTLAIAPFIMTVLIATIGEGKGSWALLGQLISTAQWEAVYLIGAEFAKKFTHQKQFTFVAIPEATSVEPLTAILIAFFEGKIFGEVAVNFSSGNGTEHMALLNALLKVGAGPKLVGVNEKGQLIEY